MGGVIGLLVETKSRNESCVLKRGRARSNSDVFGCMRRQNGRKSLLDMRGGKVRGLDL